MAFLISGDQQVRLWLGMLLYVGCFSRSLSNRFFIHLGDSFDSVYARVLGKLFAVIKRRDFPNPERLSRTGVGWRGLIPNCNAVAGSVCG